jgi:hypothetical protein
MLDFHKDLRIDKWPLQNDEYVKAFSEDISTWILGDPHRTEARRLKRMNIPAPYFFFRQHPWLCGLWKYYIQIQLQSLAITFVNAWGSVMYCGHLYSALGQEGLVQKRWSDMDLALAIQDIVVVQSSSQPEDYLKRFLLSIASSATNFSAKDKSRKKKGLVRSSRGPQQLKELAPVLQTFKERYCDANPRFDLRAQDVERILEMSEWQYEMDENGNPVTLVKDSDHVPGLVKAPTKQVTIAKLVSILRAGMQAEILELSFDWLTLHRFCWRLLRAVKDKCRDRLIQMHGPDYIEHEYQLPYIVGYIFATATNTKHLADFMKIKKTDEVTSRVMLDAASELEGMLAAGAGDMVGTILREKLGVPFEFSNSDNED